MPQIRPCRNARSSLPSPFTEHALAPGIYIEKPTALRAHADRIVSVLHETATRLTEMGAQRLSQFVLRSIAPAQSAEEASAPLAAPLLDKLVSAFPAFDDKATVDGQGIGWVSLARVWVLSGLGWVHVAVYAYVSVYGACMCVFVRVGIARACDSVQCGARLVSRSSAACCAVDPT